MVVGEPVRAEPVRVVIIGGGCGAMTAAYELSRPEHNGRYAITVYQQGWRLGGKGASGRGPSARVEEHGLHVWLGFYENSFRMMRECYAALEASPEGSPFGPWQEAFLPEMDVGLFSRSGSADWQKWTAQFPPRPGLPGDPLEPGAVYSMAGYLQQAIAMLRTLILDVEVSPSTEPRDGAQPADLLEAMAGWLAGGTFTGAALIVEGLALLSSALRILPLPVEAPLIRFVEELNTSIRSWLEERWLTDHPKRYIWEIVDLVLAIIVGSFRFNLLRDPRGLDAIDYYECREWLRLNGASERAVRSPFVVGLYDLALAYEDGDSSKPALAAGQAIRGSLRMFFGYRGSLFWRLRAGMGDVVFAPLYALLRRRGVRFKFFNKLTNVQIPAGPPIEPGDRSHVEALEFDVQAEIHGNRDYDPLINVGHRPCWPSQPDFEQLVDGDRLRHDQRDFESHWDRSFTSRRRLEVKRDFDAVVLGVSIGAVPHVCPQILARDQRWATMVEKVKTTATQAFQLWLQEDLSQLGWQGPPYIVSAFDKPFDTWCDMAHVIPEEAWARPPATAIYFCGVLRDPPVPPPDSDSHYPLRRTEEVRENAMAFLRSAGSALWPRAYDAAGAFRWELLADPSPSEGAGESPGAEIPGEQRFLSQYWRANVNPSDRYVLALPGSLKHRISPLDPTYDNLTIAGDWTDCGFNEGCTEAAVISGRLAAHALSASPPLAEIHGYDHP
ncbi:NAD(P)-binding protein [Cyanobium sp. N.Huapi 1H5]|uniref:NAD(P)-binding protein n=1 Tax=Cyanobium sp. N.Huapi 1H5 TaxID=2823719 RepID=UPI0020CC8E41|nr:NAD(P)-binding protein [Cyanobium sp. N.Huapi 1H5]MCP9835975.1 NAD(P)-binding protein [Cyanobium sp. N.Huapi 1H5]